MMWRSIPRLTITQLELEIRCAKELSRLTSVGVRVFQLYLMLLVCVFGLAAQAASISTNWSYEIAVSPGAPTPDAASKLIAGAARLFGSVNVGSGQDSGTVDKNLYLLRSQIDGSRLLSAVTSNLNVNRESSGRFVNGVALTMRYTDRRGNSPELMSAANLTSKQYEFSKGGVLSHTEPLTVAASDLLIAPYAFIGKPAPTKSTFLALSDGRTIRKINLTPKYESMKVSGLVINVVRLSGSTSAGRFDLWIRAEDGYPVRMLIGLGLKYGASLDQRATKIPTNFVIF